jgi:hypothetical protein
VVWIGGVIKLVELAVFGLFGCFWWGFVFGFGFVFGKVFYGLEMLVCYNKQLN